MSDGGYDGPDEGPQCPNQGKCEDAEATSAVQWHWTQCRGCFKLSPGCASGFSADSNGRVESGEALTVLSIVRALDHNL